MTAHTAMPSAYLELAKERVQSRFLPYKQPEDFGYDFRDWVSPYTKGAHAVENVAVVLQDWSSVESISRGVDQGIQYFGRTIDLLTNRRLEQLLSRVFGLSLEDVYATNVFPFIKPGGMSSRIPLSHVIQTATRFSKRELEIVKPKMVLALGKMAYIGLTRAVVRCYYLPHPAARIGSTDDHEALWRERLGMRRLRPVRVP